MQLSHSIGAEPGK